MLIGVPRESRPSQRLVAATPTTVAALITLGHQVVVEPGAGDRAAFSDSGYAEAGAAIGDPWVADLVVKVDPPTAPEIARVRSGALVTALMAPSRSPSCSTPSPSRASARWRSTPSRGSPAPSLWTCCPRWPTCPDTAR